MRQLRAQPVRRGSLCKILGHAISSCSSFLATRVSDLHRNYVGGVERGERNVSLLNIVKLAHELSVRATKLIELRAFQAPARPTRQSRTGATPRNVDGTRVSAALVNERNEE